MNSYEVHFNRSKFATSTFEEAKGIALDLIESSCPFEAKIVEVDEGGEFVRTVETLGSVNALCHKD